jgi:hypothetical protein
MGGGSEVYDSYAAGDIIFDGQNAGGLIGQTGPNIGNRIERCYATGNVDGDGGANDDKAGGLVGYIQQDAVVRDCYATGDVTANRWVGGLVGDLIEDARIEYSHATGFVRGERTCGGLAGSVGGDSMLLDSYATGNVEYGISIAGDQAGGLVGILVVNIGAGIERCYAMGDVSGVGGDDQLAGGLVGTLDTGVISQSYALVNVTNIESVGGGLVGYMPDDSTITQCFARGNVTVDVGYAGGLVGSNQVMNPDSIEYSYSTGVVTAVNNVGGLVGEDASGTVDNDTCYYDTNTSGQSDDDGRGEPRATVQMWQVANYQPGVPNDWDFTAVWIIDGNNDNYPYLRTVPLP